MSNPFDGVQFREHSKGDKISWSSEPPTFATEWADVGDRREFAKGTEFRMTPRTHYQVSLPQTKAAVYTTKKDVMTAIAIALEAGQFIEVTPIPVETDLGATMAARRIQYIVSDDRVVSSWQGFRALASVTLSPITLRVRPDHYHRVVTRDGLISGEVDFDDIERLAKYVDNRIRTNGLDFSVTRMAYV